MALGILWSLGVCIGTRGSAHARGLLLLLKDRLWDPCEQSGGKSTVNVGLCKGVQGERAACRELPPQALEHRMKEQNQKHQGVRAGQGWGFSRWVQLTDDDPD